MRAVNEAHGGIELLPPQLDFPNQGDFPLEEKFELQLMARMDITGTRMAMTEADIATMAQLLGFDMSTVNFDPSIQAVPEPAAYGLCAGAGLVGLVLARRRRRI